MQTQQQSLSAQWEDVARGKVKLVRASRHGRGEMVSYLVQQELSTDENHEEARGKPSDSVQKDIAWMEFQATQAACIDEIPEVVSLYVSHILSFAHAAWFAWLCYIVPTSCAHTTS